MVANRSLGNPTDRDENGGLWKRVFCGSRTAVPRETGGELPPDLGQCTCATFLSKPKREPASRFHSLAHLIDEELLARAFARLRSDAAVGVDGITKDQYGQDLQSKLRDLHERLKTMRYRHQPIRRVHIPKEKKGQTRPIGIPTVSADYPGLQRVFGMGRSPTSIPPAERPAFPGP
jgi:hypothetical protein